jgi:hypothetical protein
MAEDCVWVLDGRILTKSQAVAEAKDGPRDFLSNHLDYANVRFLKTPRLFRGAKPGPAKGGAKAALSGLIHGFDETENGKSLLPKTIPYRSKTRVGGFKIGLDKSAIVEDFSRWFWNGENTATRSLRREVGRFDTRRFCINLP